MTTESYLNDDPSWLASDHGKDTAESGSATKSAFAGLYPNGFLPSGTAVAKVNGYIVPLDAGASDGSQTFFGCTAEPVKLNANSAPQVGVAVQRMGIVRVARTPFQTGKGKWPTAAPANFVYSTG